MKTPSDEATKTAGHRLRIPRPVLVAILAHAREAAPEEGCGVLAGSLAARNVHAAFPVRNAAARPTEEYLLDPQEQLRTLLRIEDDLGLDVVGFYHSHPAGPPRPSAVDAARATWPGATHLLVWLAPEEGYGAWRSVEGAFTMEAIEVV